MYPNYIGQALQSLSGDVREFVEAPSRNRYRQSMADLENAKFEAQKPMMEMQMGEAKEMTRPATIADLVSPGMPEHIRALILAENNIDGQPSPLNRMMSGLGVTKGENDVLFRDGKPLPFYALRAPRNQAIVGGVLKAAIKPNKYADFKIAELQDKADAGTATPEELAELDKFSKMTPQQRKGALMRHGQELKMLYDEAIRRGDEAEAQSVWRDAEYNMNQIKSIDAALADEADFERQKELETFKAGLQEPKDTRTEDIKEYQYAVTNDGYLGSFQDWLKSNRSDKTSKPEMTHTQALKRLADIERAKVQLQETGGIPEELFMSMSSTVQQYLTGKDTNSALEALKREAAYIEKNFAPTTVKTDPSDPGGEVEAAVKSQYPNAYKVGSEWRVKQDGKEYVIEPEGL